MAELSTMPRRFQDKVHVDADTGCWLWTGSTYRTGYGAYWADGGMRRAHRHAYKALVRTLAADEHIDHTCFERLCVNPDHLRPVTQKQNNEHLRGPHANSKSGIRGVFWHERDKVWRVQVGHKGRRISGGSFKSRDEAERRAIALRADLFTHDDHGSDPSTIRDVTPPKEQR